MVTDDQVSEGPEDFLARALWMCVIGPHGRSGAGPLPGVLDADLACGKKAFPPYWVSEITLLNVPSLYLLTLAKKGRGSTSCLAVLSHSTPNWALDI